MTLTVDATIEIGTLTISVELSVEPGETVALVGPNGSGKTTLLRAVAGLHRVAAGRIVHDGAVWDDGAERFATPDARDVGVVFQRYLLFDHMSTLENVAFGLRARGTSRGSARRDALAWLDRLGVGGVAGRRPAELSGGQQQRVAIARALAADPGVVLLDEPFAALDASARAALRHDLGAGLTEVTAARVLVAHDVADVRALADRVVVLESGTVTQQGDISMLASAPRTPFVADLLGTNLLQGVLVAGTFRSAGGFELAVGAHDAADGPVLASIRPAAVALHRRRPEGSPRNVWQTEVVHVDDGGDRVRVRLAAPGGLVVEVTPAGLAALGAGPGDEVWASVKASEVGVVPD